jgi:hypothetical protein
MKDRKIQLVIGDINAPPQRFSANQHPSNRVVFVTIQILHFMRNKSQHGTTGGAPPDEVCTEILRMQSAQLKCHA